MIRPATIHDVVAIVGLCFECEESMHWKDHGLHGDPRSVTDTILALVDSPDAGVGVVELEGKVVGMCAVAMQGWAWNAGARWASEIIWHMAPSFPSGPAKNRWLLRMLDTMRAWASANGATFFKVNARWDDAVMCAALKRRGLTPFETVFVSEVSDGR